jgi:hypothetical protein
MIEHSAAWKETGAASSLYLKTSLSFDELHHAYRTAMSILRMQLLSRRGNRSVVSQSLKHNTYPTLVRRGVLGISSSPRYLHTNPKYFGHGWELPRLIDQVGCYVLSGPYMCPSALVKCQVCKRYSMGIKLTSRRKRIKLTRHCKIKTTSVALI